MTKIEIIDGGETVGGSKILVTYNEESILLDFGLNYTKWSSLFEEYLQPRSSTGAYDLLKTGILPPFDLYRSDLLYDNPNLIPVNLKAVFLSHAHLDHAGLIPFLKADVPVITSPTSFKILKVMQTMGTGTVFTQFIVSKLRVHRHDPSHNMVLASGPKKIDRTYLTDQSGNIGSFHYEMFPVAHSIPGAVSFYLETPDKKIVYTGDLNAHGFNAKNTEKFAEEMGKRKIYILITEGTRIAEKGAPVRTEDSVKRSIVSALLNTKGIAIIDFSSRNIDRMKTALLAANETGRKLVITLEDAYLLLNIDPGLLSKVYIYAEKKLSYFKWLKPLTPFRHSPRMITDEDINKNLTKYALCLSLFDMQSLLDIDTPGGSYIYSSSEPYNEQQVMNFDKMHKWIELLGLHYYGFTNDRFHSSGHALREELLHIITTINPKHILPVHTEHPEEFKNLFKEQVISELKEDKELTF